MNWLCEKHGIGSDWKIPEVNARVYLNIHVNEIIGLLDCEVGGD